MAIHSFPILYLRARSRGCFLFSALLDLFGFVYYYSTVYCSSTNVHSKATGGMGHKLAQHGGGTTDSVLFASVFAVFYSLVCSVPHLDVEDIANGYDLCTAAPPVTGLRRTVFAQLQHAVGTGKRARECTGEHGEGGVD